MYCHELILSFSHELILSRTETKAKASISLAMMIRTAFVVSRDVSAARDMSSPVVLCAPALCFLICVYVYVYVCVYIYDYDHVHIHIYVCINIYGNTYKHIHVNK